MPFEKRKNRECISGIQVNKKILIRLINIHTLPLLMFLLQTVCIMEVLPVVASSTTISIELKKGLEFICSLFWVEPNSHLPRYPSTEIVALDGIMKFFSVPSHIYGESHRTQINLETL
jgi:hypothetical protein